MHQARVATRRLRSDLRTFRTLLDKAALAPLIDELRWLGGLLGGARRRRVASGWVRRLTPSRIRPGGRSPAALPGVGRPQAPPRRAARGARQPPLPRPHPGVGPPRVTPPIVEEPDRPAREAYPELASRPWEHLSKRVSALGKHPTDAELHRVRILAKRARYAAEAASAVIPAAGRHAEAIAGLQGVLGDHQDAVVAQQWLRDSIASDATAPEAFVAGLLVRDEQALARKYRRRWPDAWAIRPQAECLADAVTAAASPSGGAEDGADAVTAAASPSGGAEDGADAVTAAASPSGGAEDGADAVTAAASPSGGAADGADAVTAAAEPERRSGRRRHRLRGRWGCGHAGSEGDDGRASRSSSSTVPATTTGRAQGQGRTRRRRPDGHRPPGGLGGDRLALPAGRDLGEVGYTAKGRPKVVHYWSMQVTRRAPSWPPARSTRSSG